MKKLVLVLIVILNLFQQSNLKAQHYVTIPDAHFVTYLQANFPTCMNGNQMDTTCAGITNTLYISCANDSIADLTGIQYFDGLQTLYCSHNLLTSLPRLPRTLRTFGCDYNLMTSLPSFLPDTLEFINCSYNNLPNIPTLPSFLTQLLCDNNQLVSLPTLPNALTNLQCSYNQITSLPTLPNTLQVLWCNSNQLTSLPTLPNSLYDLHCNFNHLTGLPTLPNSLQYLWCESNTLTSLPALPNSIQQLFCDENQLTGLPALPNSLTDDDFNNNLLTSLPVLPNSLTYLWCAYNQLTSLPTLPTSITMVWCSNNHITSLQPLNNSFVTLECQSNLLTSLPSLPISMKALFCDSNQITILPTLPNTLNQLSCANNNISCFPILPNSLIYYYNFNVSPNPFTCFPNYVPAMNATYLAYPICLTGNTNGCSTAQGIIGYTYKDNNANCIYNIADSTKRNIKEQLYDSGNNLIEQTFSAINGVYDFPEPVGTYTIKIDTAGLPYTVQCVHPGIDSTTTLTTAVPLQTNVNFPVTCKAGFDVGVQSVIHTGKVFPGQQFVLRTNAGDMSHWYGLNCAAGVSGQVAITVTGPVTYYYVVFGSLYPSVAGNTYTYNISNFGTVNNSTAFGLIFTVNSNAVAGSQICISVSVTPAGGDNNISNNTYTECFDAVNSYDPNYKETYPEQVLPAFQDYFTYTIHFQNTGNAAAMNINLKDTLDANLDLSTFQVINYSHYCTSLLTGNNLSFNFPNIQLPDSTSNFAGSQGFVQYRIKPKANLPAGTQIHNTASIYFDYNPAVVTNTTTNEFMLGVGINNYQNASLSIYPNPSNGKYIVKLSDTKDVSKLTIEVTNLLGETIYQSKINASTSSATQTTIDLSNQANGIYFVRITGGEQSLNKKIVKQ